ncbi:hypothetical protein M9458_007831 [Cirrhinus mrigala]|uniref:Pyrin domain-containing protein n=1 Tax=Cirrhinus mrigala TaxID=683832 RepID=A0ABD0RMV4_CIRMR
MTSLPHPILETLEDLSSDKLKKFKWHLKNTGLASVADLEKADATTDTVDLVVARGGRDGARKTTLDILRKMKENHLANQLQMQLQANNVITPITGHTVSVSVQGLSL